MSRSDIEAAAARFLGDGRGFIRRTPLWKLPGAALGVACAEVWLKLEHLQVGGSFKARGMYNRLLANRIPARPRYQPRSPERIAGAMLPRVRAGVRRLFG